VLFCDVEEQCQDAELSAAEAVGAKSKKSSKVTHRQVSEQICQWLQKESQSDDDVEPSESSVTDNNQKPRTRAQITCPVRDCHTRVIHLPRHLQNVHEYSKERALSIGREIRIRSISKKKPSLVKLKHKDYHHYRNCAISNCHAVVKRLPQHLMTVHSIPEKSQLLKKLLGKAKMQMKQLQLAGDSECYATGDNRDSSNLFTVEKASSQKRSAGRDSNDDDTDHGILLKAKKVDLENNEELDLDRASDCELLSNKSLSLMQEEVQDYEDDYIFSVDANKNTGSLANENDVSTYVIHSHNAKATDRETQI